MGTLRQQPIAAEPPRPLPTNYQGAESRVFAAVCEEPADLPLPLVSAGTGGLCHVVHCEWPDGAAGRLCNKSDMCTLSGITRIRRDARIRAYSRRFRRLRHHRPRPLFTRYARVIAARSCWRQDQTGRPRRMSHYPGQAHGRLQRPALRRQREIPQVHEPHHYMAQPRLCRQLHALNIYELPFRW